MITAKKLLERNLHELTSNNYELKKPLLYALWETISYEEKIEIIQNCNNEITKILFK